RGQALDGSVAGDRRPVIIKDKLPREAGRVEDAYAVLSDRLPAPEIDRQDGLRLAWPDEAKWLHLRPSGTEPILRIMAEAPTESEAHDLVAKAREALVPAEAPSPAAVGVREHTN